MCNTLIIIEMYLTPHYYAPDGRGKQGYDFPCIKPSIQHRVTKRSTNYPNREQLAVFGSCYERITEQLRSM